MAIERINFRGTESQIKPQEKPQTTETTPETVDEEKSNASKYMIGATALAGIITLGVLGYKGKLGKGIQNMLGNGEKAADEVTSSITNTKNTDVPGKSKVTANPNEAQDTNKVPELNQKQPDTNSPEIKNTETPEVKTAPEAEVKTDNTPQPEIAPPPPKVEPRTIGAPTDKLKGKELLDANFEDMAKKEGQDLNWLCYSSQKEIANLSDAERPTYIQKYLEQLKNVDIKKFDDKREVFNGLFNPKFDNKKSAEMIIAFAKENPSYQPTVINDVISSITDLFHQHVDAAKKSEFANVIDMLAKSGFKHEPKEWDSLRKYTFEWAVHTSELEAPATVDKLSKLFALKCKKLDLALGMDKEPIRGIIKTMEEYPEYFKQVLNITEKNKGKFIQELKDSYKQFSGKDLADADLL